MECRILGVRKINSSVFTLSGRFRITGNARFLSHQETMRTLARAIVRSSIEPVYSEGFNPHLRLSIPLPRNVGLAGEDEIFCVRIKPSENLPYRDSLARQLPEGFELISVELSEKKVSYQPDEVEYFIKLNLTDKQNLIEEINKQIEQGGEILMERTINEDGDIKILDVSKYLKSFEPVENGVKATCKVLPTGTIRPDEILKLLNIETYEISSSIIRKKVNWKVA